MKSRPPLFAGEVPVVSQRTDVLVPRGSDAVHGPDELQLLLPRNTSSRLVDMNLGGAVRQGLESCWLDIFLPADTRNGMSTLVEWAYRCVATSDRTKALDEALSATAVTRVGHARDDADMHILGLTAYARALKYLQKALWDPELVLRDETLAACLLLMTFEVL